MSYFGMEYTINPRLECKAIADYLESYWEIQMKPQKHMGGAVDSVLRAGITQGIAVFETELERPIALYNGLIQTLPKSSVTPLRPIDFKRVSSNKDAKIDLDTKVHIQELTLRKDWIIDAHPSKYAAFIEACTKDRTHDVFQDYVFRGSKLHPKLSSVGFDFVSALKPKNLYCAHTDHGRKPLTVLVEAIYRQGMNIGGYVVEKRWGSPAQILARLQH